jgi:rfaE bifunctional protein nucleotidyltransferase chain/domain
MDLPAPRFISKIGSAEDFAQRVAALPRPIVFTNGVFDIVHRGHVSYLDQAASLGRSLVVGVNADESVRRLAKGPERPLNGLDDRLAVLAALGSVDLVVPFAEDTPYELIAAIRPDVLVKGGDWAVSAIVGREFVEARGGRVVAILLREGLSTTTLVARARAGRSALDP